MSVILKFIDPLIEEFTKGWKPLDTAPQNELIRLFAYRGKRGWKIATGFIVAPMTIEAGINQPDADCDYSKDEQAFLKAGFYSKCRNFNDMDPVYIPLKPIAFKPLSETQEGS